MILGPISYVFFMDALGAIWVQVEVLRALDPVQDETRKISFVGTFGKKMREIIDTFPKKTGKDPTPADIIWCLWYDVHEDPRVLMQCIVPYNTSEKNNE